MKPGFYFVNVAYRHPSNIDDVVYFAQVAEIRDEDGYRIYFTGDPEDYALESFDGVIGPKVDFPDGFIPIVGSDN